MNEVIHIQGFKAKLLAQKEEKHSHAFSLEAYVDKENRSTGRLSLVAGKSVGLTADTQFAADTLLCLALDLYSMAEEHESTGRGQVLATITMFENTHEIRTYKKLDDLTKAKMNNIIILLASLVVKSSARIEP